MTVKYKNFYENLQEAHRRLLRSVVTYEGEPGYILAITNHRADEVFRVYLEPLDRYAGDKPPKHHGADNYHTESPDLGAYLDKWMEANKTSGIIRKRIDARGFNQFRPFPLGMCNYKAQAFYLERQPLRQGHQGLIRGHISETRVTLGSQPESLSPGRSYVEIMSKGFRSCILGEYPSPEAVLKGLKDPDVSNEAVGFHRHFALIRGPIEMMFLAYKGDVVGVLPRNDFSELRLGRDFQHTREVIRDMKLFTTIL